MYILKGTSQFDKPKKARSKYELKYDALSISHTKEELENLANAWMLEEFGDPRTLNESAQNKWHERNGVIFHFIRSIYL